MSEEGCAYLVSRYPSVTQTFVAGEVRELRRSGMRVETATVRRAPADEPLSARDREERARTYAILPPRPGRLVAAHLRALAAAPGAYLATLGHALRSAPAGGRARLWQLFYFGEAMLLWAWLRERRLHHVHVHHANVASDVAMLVCRYANASGARPDWTWSLTVHGPTELLDVAGHRLADKVADAALVVCISDFTRSQVAAVADPDHLGKLHTVRCGIDVGDFRPGDAPRASHQILCVAALSRRKGHAVLLEALAHLRHRLPDAELVLAGDGPERAFLEGHAHTLGLDGAVRFVGAVDHDRVADLGARAAVFCLPSFAEGVPTVLMEAMAMELPVVATNVMGVPELVDHERTGLLVPPARADLLAGALERLLIDPDLRRAMGRAGRRRVEQDYERGAAVSALRSLLAPLAR